MVGKSTGVKTYDFYLASGFSWRHNFRELTKELLDRGHTVKSEWIWIDERPERSEYYWEDFAKRISAANLIDLHRSNALVLDTRGIRPDGNGGAHTELGFALARDWPIFLIGPRNNTFQWSEGIKTFKNEDELLEHLRNE